MFFLLLLLSISAKAQYFIKTATGIKLKTANGITEVQMYSPSIVRILKWQGGLYLSKGSFSVIARPSTTVFNVKANHGVTELTTAALKLTIANNGKITFYNAKGRLLMAENDNGSRYEREGSEKNMGITQSFKLPRRDAIYGLGQHQEGTMNYRNKTETLLQKNMEIAVPFVTTSGGYGLFWDNASLTHFKDADGITSFESAAGDAIDYYFINGGDADGVVAGLRTLTGDAPMFPRWVFGFWQSRERYTSQTQLVDVVKKYRNLRVPLDGIVQDWQYWGIGDDVWNAVKFGNPLYPDPKKMADSIHALNAHLIISVWPNFGPKTEIYREFSNKNLLFDFKTWPEAKGVKVYDAFNPIARDIYWKYINQNLYKYGVDGWWLDATEPEQGNIAQSDSTKTFAGSFQSVRNAYPLLTTGGVYNHQRNENPHKRVFILTRSAFAGQQRYGTMTWSGDIQGSWDVLRKQISGGLNLSLSGIPYWNTDIGGFYSGIKYPKGIEDLAFHELYTRWFEFAAFTPMFRSHGTNAPREIYQFGKKGDWAFDVQHKFINLRYRLQPYIYSTAWQVTHGHSTMMRALVMDFAADKAVHNINDEYLFGKSIFVAPVTDSMYVSRSTGQAIANFGSVKQRQIYLPKGANWVDFWNGITVAGGTTLSCDAPIDEIPLFVKAGSILPLGPVKQYTGELDDHSLEIRIYPGSDAHFVLYEDSGDGYDYEMGKYSTIDFSWNNKSNTLTIDNYKGNFPEILHTRTFNIVLVKQGTGTGVNTQPAKKTVKYSGKKLETIVK